MRHFDHELNEEERELLEQHLASCPECRALMADLQGIMLKLETSPMMEPPSHMEEMVMKRIQPMPDSQESGSNNFLKALYGSMSFIAVMLACAVTLGVQDGILSLISEGAVSLNSFIENAWNFQIVYNLVSELFSQIIFSVLNTIQAVYVIAGFAAIIVGFKKLLQSGAVFQKAKD
jgi:hypothetical protein